MTTNSSCVRSSLGFLVTAMAVAALGIGNVSNARPMCLRTRVNRGGESSSAGLPSLPASTNHRPEPLTAHNNSRRNPPSLLAWKASLAPRNLAILVESGRLAAPGRLHGAIQRTSSARGLLETAPSLCFPPGLCMSSVAFCKVSSVPTVTPQGPQGLDNVGDGSTRARKAFLFLSQ